MEGGTEVCFLSSSYNGPSKGSEWTYTLERDSAEDRLGLLRPHVETRPELSVPHLFLWTPERCLPPKRKN